MARIARWSVLRLMVHFHRLHIHAETLSWRMCGILIHLLDIVVPIRPRLGVDQAKCVEQLKTSARMILQVACFLQIYLPRLIASAPHVARDPQTSFQAGHRMDNWTSKSSMSCPAEKILIPLSLIKVSNLEDVWAVEVSRAPWGCSDWATVSTENLLFFWIGYVLRRPGTEDAKPITCRAVWIAPLWKQNRSKTSFPPSISKIFTCFDYQGLLPPSSCFPDK